MPNNLYTFSVPLRKGEAHACGHKIAPSALLTARLFPHMFPLTGQVQAACDTAKRQPAGWSGLSRRALRTMKLPLKNCTRGSNERQSLSGNFRLMLFATPIRARSS